MDAAASEKVAQVIAALHPSALHPPTVGPERCLPCPSTQDALVLAGAGMGVCAALLGGLIPQRSTAPHASGMQGHASSWLDDMVLRKHMQWAEQQMQGRGGGLPPPPSMSRSRRRRAFQGGATAAKSHIGAAKYSPRIVAQGGIVRSVLQAAARSMRGGP